jgi:ethanolamine transporter EutH
MDSSTAASIAMNMIVFDMLYNMKERTTLITMGIACCAASALSGVVRTVQYIIHALFGVRTY